MSDLICNTSLLQDVVIAPLNALVELGMIRATGGRLGRGFTYCCRLA
jgi:hypothetical protein